MLPAILVLAAALRLTAAFHAGFAHQDELFQYFEQAHRLAFGQGIVPWEYRYGMRGGLLPLLLAAPMKAGALIAPDTGLYLLLPRLAVAALSLGLVAGAWRIGRAISPLHAALCALAAAIWPELAHMAPHTLGEPLALALFVPAAALLLGARPRPLLAGLLLGLAGVLRFQYLPAIAALMLASPTALRAHWRALLVGGGLALWIGFAADLALGQTPFAWLAENIRQNLLFHRADRYGVAPPLAYVQVLATVWGGWLIPIVALAAIGARRQPALMAAALVNLAVHLLIAHKEYRFILLSDALLVLLAAIGTGELVAWSKARIAPAVALAGWLIAAATLGASGRAATFDTPAGPARALFSDLHIDAALCGLATSGISFADGGGYTLLHRAVPLFAYQPDERAALLHDVGGFNRLIAPVDAAPPPGFARATCRSGASGFAPACLYARPGRCRAIGESHEINHVLIRIDQ